MKSSLIAVLFVMANFAGSVQADIDVDQDTGTTYGAVDSLGPAPLGPPNTDCTLTVPPVVTNGQVFSASVSYHVYVPEGDRFEKFEFNWPSDCDYFTERTVRLKEFTPGSAGVSSSFESVVTPGAGCIQGTFEAVVKVKGTVHCKATATMTVN